MRKAEKSSCDHIARRNFSWGAVIVAVTFALGQPAGVRHSFAKDVYPSEKITIIVPYQAGSGYDVWIRTFSPFLTKYLKQVSPGAKGGDIFVRNEPASAGRKGYSLLYRSKPNGYTLGTIGSGGVIETILDTEAKSEVNFKALTYLLLGSSTVKMVVTAQKGFKDWGEVLEVLKKGPVKISVGSFGRYNHAATIVMQETLGIKFKMIPFQGTVEGTNALMRGDVQLAMVDEDSVYGLVEAKEIRPILNFTEVSDYPGAVSIKELGYPELAFQFKGNRFLVAPPGLEGEPKKTLLEAIRRASEDKEYLALAKRSRMRVEKIVGDDAENGFRKFVGFFENIAPSLRRNFEK